MIAPSAPCSRRWRAQLPDASPPPISRNSTSRSATRVVEEAVDLAGDLLAFVLLEEMRRAFDHHEVACARDQVHEPPAGLGREDRVRVGEAHECGFFPFPEPLARTVHL